MIENMEMWLKIFVQDRVDEKYQEWLMAKKDKSEILDSYKSLNNHFDWLVEKIKKLDKNIVDQLNKEKYITDEYRILKNFRHIIREIIDPRIERIRRNYLH